MLNDNVICGLPMVILMLGTGVFLAFLTKGVIFTKFHIVAALVALVINVDQIPMPSAPRIRITAT